MKSRAAFCMVLAGLLLAVNVKSASASLASSLYFGKVNTLTDISESFAVETSSGAPLLSTDTIGVGDTIVGIANITTNVTGPILNVSGQLDFVFAYKITAVGSAAAQYADVAYSLAADPTLLKQYLPAFAANISNNDAIAVLANGSAPTGSVGSVTNLDSASAFAVLNGTSQAGYPAGYSLDAAAGIIQPGDYIAAELENFSATPTNAITVASLIAQGSGTPIGNDAGGFTVDYSPGLAFVAGSQITQTFPTIGNTPAEGSKNLFQAGFNAQLYVPNDPNLGWDFQDNTHVLLDPLAIPEPASIVVWSVLIAGASWIGMRVRRQGK
jgi:hypothetical protein